MIISVVNQKGGVGKTTTVINLGSYFSLLGKKVLIVDLDPQANATSGLGLNPQEIKEGIYEVLLGKEKGDFIKNLSLNLKIIPSTLSLAGANIELIDLEDREFRLKKVLSFLKENFDYIFIDSPPSLGILTINGLVASEKVLIPIQAEYYALEGLGQLFQTIELVRKNLNPHLEILGGIITMFDLRTKLSLEVLKELYKNFPGKIFRSVIPRNVRLAEAPSFGKNIFEYDKLSKGARAYKNLAKELISYL